MNRTISGKEKNQLPVSIKNCLVMLLFLFVLFSKASANWTMPEIIDNNPNNATMLDFAFDTGTGNGMGVYVQNNGISNAVYAVRYQIDSGWIISSSQQLSDNGQNASQPQIGFLGAGKYIVLFKRSNILYQRIISRVFNGTGWTLGDTVCNLVGFDADIPKLSTNPTTQHALAIWHQSNGVNPKIYSRFYYYPSGWQTIHDITVKTNTSNCIPDADVYLCNSALDTGYVVYIMRHVIKANDLLYGARWVGNSSTWNDTMCLSLDSVSNESSPRIVAENGWNAMVVYQANNKLFSKKFTNGWQTSAEVNSTTGTIAETQLAHISGNDYMAVYKQGTNIKSSKYSVGVWSTPVVIDANTGSAAIPWISFTANGKGIAVYKESNKIFANKYDGTNWGSPMLIDTSTFNAADVPRITFCKGMFPVVFIQSNGMNTRVFSTIHYDKKLWDNGFKDTSWGNIMNWRPNGLPSAIDTVIFDGIVSAAHCSLTINDTVASILFFNSPGAFNFNQDTLCITKNADFSNCQTLKPGTGALKFIGSSAKVFTPKNTITFHKVIQDAPGFNTQLSINSLHVDTLEIRAGDFTASSARLVINGDLKINSGKFFGGNGVISVGRDVTIGSNPSQLSMPSDTFYVGRSWYNNTGGKLYRSSLGKMVFNSSSTGNVIYQGNDTLGHIVFNGNAASWTLSQSLVADSMTIVMGSVNGTAGQKYSVASLYSSANTGTLDFSICTLAVSKNADFSNIQTITATNGRLKFTGSSGTQNFTPKSICTFPPIVKNNSSILQVNSYPLRTDSLYISAGTFNMNSQSLRVNYGLKVDNTGTFNGSSGKDTIGSSVEIGSSGTVTPTSDTMFIGKSLYNNAGGTFTSGTNGVVVFTSINTGQMIYPGSGNLGHVVFKGSGGAWTFNGNLSADSLIINYGTVNFSAGSAYSIGKFYSQGGGGIINFSACTLKISYDADFTGLSQVISSTGWLKFVGSSGTQLFSPNFSYPFSYISKTNGGTVTVSTYPLQADSIIISGGTFDMNEYKLTSTTNLVVNSSGTFTGSKVSLGGGLYNFAGATYTAISDTLFIGKDLYNAGTFNANTNSYIVFNATGPAAVSPGSSPYKRLIFDGAGGTWTLNQNLSADTLVLKTGLLDLGASNILTLNAIKGQVSGALKFHKSSIKLNGNADFSALGSLYADTGTLEFIGTSAQYFYPKSTTPPRYPRIKQNGSGGTTITADIAVDSVVVSAGALDIGSNTLTADSSLIMNGGMLEAASGNLSIRNLSITGGTLNAPGLFKNFYIKGNYEKTGGTFTHNNGKLLFNGTTGPYTITPGAAAYNKLSFDYTGNDWTLTGNLSADTLDITSGILNLGTGKTHSVGAVTTVTGTLDFGSSTLQISKDANLSYLTTLTPGTGTLEFTKSSGVTPQVFTPKAGQQHPAISHIGSDTLRLSTNNLSCNSFSQSNGKLDFNSKNIKTEGGGNFTITNGTATTFQNLAGDTIAVSGNANFSGQSGSLLNMSTGGSTWWLKVNGTLNADYANIGFCDMTGGSFGKATNSTDATGNTRWDFAPPVSAITTPVDSGYINSLATISGTANDGTGTGIKNVTLSIKRHSDNYFWNGVSSWDASETWLTADGIGPWTYSLLPAWSTGASYTILSKATDSAGFVQALPDTCFFTFDNTPPSVTSATLITPNGGQTWTATSTQSITWNNAGITDTKLKNNPVTLEYSIDGGTTFPNTIITGTANTGSYSWTLPDISSASVRVRIIVTDSANNIAMDTSNSSFSIKPSLTLTAPNGGETWIVGDNQNITWTYSGTISTVDLAYSTDGGTTFSNIITALATNSGPYTWTVPNVSSSTVKVKIWATGDASVFAVSNGNFSIKSKPAVGYYTDNAIPPAQIVQTTDGSGIITVSFRLKDPDLDLCTLKTFEYSVDNGTTWNAPANGDASASLGTGWANNNSSKYASAAGWSGTVHSFTFNTKHADVTGLSGIDQSDVKIRFYANDGIVNSASPGTSDAFQVNNASPTGLAAFSVSTYTATSATLTWTAAVDAHFSHYEIWYGTNQTDVQNRAGNEWDNSDDANLSSSATTLTAISGLSSGLTYYFKIWAVDQYGNDMTATELSQSLNVAPTYITLSNNTINENQASGTTVGTFTTTDGNAGDAHTYTLEPGTGSTDNGSFTIDNNQLKTAVVFDYETKNSYDIRVRTTDNGTGNLYYEKEFTINITNINDPPVLSGTGGSISYTENDAAMVIDDDITATDEDNPYLNSAAVTITGNYVNGQDVLSYTLQGTITGVFTSSTGTVNFTGTGSIADYQAVLRSVSYNNTSENPSTLTRTVSFSIYDGATNSNTITRDITVASVNDPPILSGSGGLITYTENYPPMVIDNAITVTDADNTSLDSAFAKISAYYYPSEDVLSFTPSQGSITGSFDIGTGILSLAGAGTISQYQTVLRSVKYVNSSQNPKTPARTVSFSVYDDTDYSTEVTRDITIISVNDPPVAVADDYAATQNNELNVSAGTGLLSNDSDPDGDLLEVLLVSDVTHGKLTLYTDGSFSYIPAENFIGYDAFTYVATDKIVNSNVATVAITVSDATIPSIVSQIPDHNAVNVGMNQILSITFSEKVYANIGSIVIGRVSDLSVFKTISVGSGNVSGSGTTVISINPAASFESETEYFVTIDATCFKDSSGNYFPGLTANTDWRFTTADFVTLTPILTTPASNSALDSSFEITITVPEAALSGSVKMTFTKTGTNGDPNSPHVIVFDPLFETAGDHSTTLIGWDLSSSPYVTSVSSSPNDALIHNEKYSVKLEYQDASGNPAASVVNTNITYSDTLNTILHVLKADYLENTRQLKIVFRDTVNSDHVFSSNTVGLYISNNTTDAVTLETPWQWQSGATHDTVLITLTSAQAVIVASWTDVGSLLALYLEANTFGNGAVFNKLLDYTLGYHVHFVKDIVPPLPVEEFKLAAVNCSTMTVSWKPSPSSDAAEVKLCASDSAMPYTWEEGNFFAAVPASETGVIMTGLPPYGVRIFVSSFVRDYAGNWSPHHPGSAGAVTLPDGVPPVNTVTAALANINDTAIGVTLKVSSAVKKDEAGILIYYGTLTSRKRSLDSCVVLFQDTAFVLHKTVKQGWWGVAWAPFDSSGNIGGFREDSVFIGNTPPALSLAGSYSLKERESWKISSFVSDVNNDPITLFVLQMPLNMVLSQSSGSLSWTPSWKDVGMDTIIVIAQDDHGGADTAAVVLIVNNIIDPPSLVSVTVPGEAFERKPFTGSMLFSDGDWEDSLSIFITPATWLGIAGVIHQPADSFWHVTLKGIPMRKDTGLFIYTVQVTDAYNAAVYVRDTVYVNTVNAPPFVVAGSVPDTGYQDSLLRGSVTIGERDPGDSVAIQLSPNVPWLTVKKIIHLPDDSLWMFFLEGAPAQKDTGLKVYTLQATDKSGASVTLNDTLRIIDKDDPPVTLLIRKDKTFGAALYRMSAKDDYDTAFTFFASLGNPANTVTKSESNASGKFVFYPLSDGSYIFSCYAQDKHGLKDPKPFRDTVVITKASQYTWTDTGTWNMLSVPATVYNASAVKEAGSLLRWDESQVPDGIYKYYTKAGSITNLTKGESYWLKQKKELAVSLDQSAFPTDTTKLVLKKAEYGWNQIASPYPYPVKWNKKNTLWQWNPQTHDFEESEGILYPWQGYWVLVDAPDTVALAPEPLFMTKVLAKRSKTFYVSRNEWTFNAGLTTNCNSDADNLFGVSQYASDAYDDLDRPEPPRMNNEPCLFFAHPEWNRSVAQFASDIRATFNDEAAIFQIGVSPCGKELTSLSLNFSGITSDIPLYLFIYSPEGLIEYKEGMSLALNPSANEQYRTLFVTNDINFIKSFPLTFAMDHPYPNPCRPAATIKYTLPYRLEKNGWLNTQPYNTKIIIYDLKGRQIRDLVDRKQKPGHYKVVWKGDSNTGHRIASGMYFCQLKAGQYTAVKRIIVSY